MQKEPEHIDDFLHDDDFYDYVFEKSAKSDKKWNKFFEENPGLEETAVKAKKILLGLASVKDVTADNEIDEFHLHDNSEKIWKEYRNSKSRSTFLAASKWIWRSVAAAAIIVFSLVFYSVVNNFIQNKNAKPIYSEVYVPTSKQSRLTLPDGTVVWLNSETKIKYSGNFNISERNVFLDGEAYFEVTHNKKLPFKVFSKETEIKVVGTKFNIKAYSDDNTVETVLLEGKIELSESGVNNKEPIELKPGDKAIYNSIYHNVSITREDVDADIAWKDGKIIFRNTPLKEVCTTLQRWYNAEIILDDDTGELRSHPFTFTVIKEDLPLVLEYLCKAAPLSFQKEYVDEDGENGIDHIRYTIRKNK